MSPFPNLILWLPANPTRRRRLLGRVLCLALAMPGLGDHGRPALAVESLAAAAVAGPSVAVDEVAAAPPEAPALPASPPAPPPQAIAPDRKDAAPRPTSRPGMPAPAVFQRNVPAPTSAGRLRRAYASLQRNDQESARQDYEQVIQHAPHNTDALLALAAIAERRGQAAEADAFRQRALIAAPDDPAVVAASLGSGAGGDPQITESRLKIALARQPDSPPLNFALGNLYARQNRWLEAQPLYGRAVAGDGDNPDYLYNLAVSLDHLRQPRLAARHYRRAQAAAEARPVAFDPQQVGRRLAELGF